MDTNQQNNVHVNAFTKGMNTDTSLDMVNAEQYVFGQNIRITNNALLNALIDANSTEGVVTPVASGENITIQNDYEEELSHIMAVASIENTGAVIFKRTDGHWSVYRTELENSVLKFTHLFTSSLKTERDRFSVVINQELKDVIKLYIADTLHPVMCMNLYKDYSDCTEDDLISNHLLPTSKLQIVKKISGSLRTSQVQYVYRYYQKYGISSNLSPLTNKILIVDNNKNKEIGNAENTQTGVGLQLKLKYDEKCRKLFDHIQVFRLSYIKPNQNVEIDLITDIKLPENNKDFILNDNGIKSIQSYSIDEFASLNGQKIIPTIIEQNQNYLFSADISDQSVLQFEDGEFNPISVSFNKSCNATLYSDASYDEDRSITINSEDLEKIDFDKFYLNKDADINSDCGEDISNIQMFDAEGDFGGTGTNVSYKLVYTEIKVHERYNDSKKPEVTNYTKADTPIYSFNYKNDINPSTTIADYFKESGISVNDDFNVSYDEMFTSSMLRSLKRDEVYRYGIVLYNKYGSKSDVMWIADIRTPSERDFPSIITRSIRSLIDSGDHLWVRPIGIRFSVKISNDFKNKYDIIGYQIVKCEKNVDYTKNLLQCVLSRPIRQGKYSKTMLDSYRTPYYPNAFLTTDFMYVVPSSMAILNSQEAGVSELWEGLEEDGNPYFLGGATNCENDSLFLIFSPEINVRRVDILNTLTSQNIKLFPIGYVSGNELHEDINNKITTNDQLKPLDFFGTSFPAHYRPFSSKLEEIQQDGQFLYKLKETNGINGNIGRGVVFVRDRIDQTKDTKSSDGLTFFSYNYTTDQKRDYEVNMLPVDILNVSDVSNPTWEQGISNVQLGAEDGGPISAIKLYKSYVSSIGDQIYVNWAINDMYDLPVTETEARSREGNSTYDYLFKEFGTNSHYSPGSVGWIGPGPLCFLIKTQHPTEGSIFVSNNWAFIDGYFRNCVLGTIKCNIQHTAIQYAGLTREEKQYDTYYGFGNFVEFDLLEKTQTIFDGDVYILPFEVINMYKTYNFNAKYTTLMSNQITYYFPIESKINTYLDYGKNYKNTLSTNVLLEPGAIEGVTTQDRPAYQYNYIFSDNTTSNDVYSASLLEYQTNKYPQRIFYSEMKTNGEYIDNWHVFKPVDFIDTDTRYGNITDLYTVRSNIYYWQTSAFGKLSVNERSLITDTNSNTIQLGQGGVLQRTDYIDTKYGMREQDFAVIDVEGSVIWIDMYNKAIVAFSNGIVNLSEQYNVQNVVNTKIDEHFGENRPTIDYDLQNNEVLCKCLEDGQQLTFNLKLNVATSIYTRNYDRIINFNNALYGLNKTDDCTKYNFINTTTDYLSPVCLSFVVNNVPSTTKVFDNQKLVILKHKNDDSHTKEYFKTKKYKFTTDLYDGDYRNLSEELISDREGNICYAIPRVNDPLNDISYFGLRFRGKWMRVDIVDEEPNYDFAISHIITKIRQSFS